MALRLSLHLQKDMADRHIRRGYIEAVLAAPALVRPDHDPALTCSFKRIPEFGGRVLRVVHRPENGDTFVVTAHWDRGAKL